jgi:signal peptide peptidase SppA
MRYPNVVKAICNTPWAILPEKLEEITALIELKAAGFDLSAEQIQAAVGDKKPLPKPSGAIAVIPIYGVISQRLSMMDAISGGGAASTDKISQQLKQALSDPNVGSILLDIDSPGGSIFGVAELADEIYNARGEKRITAMANSFAASAAYWIATAADEFIVTPSGQVGSIGVFMTHIDESKSLEQEGKKITMISAGKYKTEGSPSEPLTDEARAAMQDKVDTYYSMFVKAVAKNRGVSVSDVRNGFGEGRMLAAAEALKLGMVDRVGTFDQTLQRLGAGKGSLALPRAEGSGSEVSTANEAERLRVQLAGL